MQISPKVEEILQGEELVPLGPNAIAKKSAWNRIMRDFRVYDAQSKEIALALVGMFREDILLIVDHIMMSSQSSISSCSYNMSDLKQIDKEAAKKGLMLGGIAHNHPSGSTKPSDQDKKSWISNVIEIDHPIYFFIVSPKNNKISCSAISLDIWNIIKNAIKPVEVAISNER